MTPGRLLAGKWSAAARTQLIRVHKPAETEVKKPLSVAPIEAFATIATIAISDPIIAYSIAVTPDLFAANTKKTARITVLQREDAGLAWAGKWQGERKKLGISIFGR